MISVTTGVIQNNSAEWLIDELYNGNNVELDFEFHVADCPNTKRDGYHDNCWESYGDSTWLIGFKRCRSTDPEAWYSYRGKYRRFGYKPDPEAEFSAIVGEINTQVVRSRWVQFSPLCSPCYPGQGNLDDREPGRNIMGDPVWAYALPPDMFSERDEPGNIVSLASLEESDE